MEKIEKVLLIQPNGVEVEFEKGVADVLVLRYGYRQAIQRTPEQIKAEKLEAEAKEEAEKEEVKKVLTKLGIEFHSQLGLRKLKALLEKALAE